MSNKKIMLALMTGVLGTSLAGCGGANDQAKAGNGGGDSSQAGPAKIKVALETGGLSYVEGSPDLNNDPYVKAVEKMANVDMDLQLIQHQNYSQNMQLLFAGGELPDLLQTQGINKPEVAPAIDAGVLLPLDELIDKYGPNLKKHIPKESWANAAVSKDGKIYGIPQENPIRNSAVTYMRKDWLDKLGLQPPKTVDEYIKVLTSFRDNDPNGNGKKDEIPFSARAKFSFGFQFFSAYDVHPQTWTFENNQLVPNFIRPGMVEALKVYKTLYDQKLIDNEFLVNQGKDWDAKIKGAGTVGMWATTSAAPDGVLAAIKANVPTAEIALIPSPVGPSGKPGGVYPLGSTVSDFVWTIPKNAKNPEAIIKFLDWFYAEGDKEKDNFFMYGLKDVNYTEQNGQIQYKYPTTNEAIGQQVMFQEWIHFTGPKRHLTDEAFLKGKPNGDLIVKSLQVAKAEGFEDAGVGMPSLPTMQARPELKYDGLWLEFAAKVVTGKESVDKFNDFVADWKKRGGDQVIKEATDWYNQTHKK
ncbi:extracellular solute-binding protein [Paenibacillus aurantius]|uniref:Extracellular solute-binding protein n=1 Tax=Paenibacillus aurantius TaxID=2918900 RepID=A0AA96LA97_9BACL|nr:extracellular solute-binding protein [Paenibacillus aurantius]WNQ09558.1 extracellular solute-binding protein [Paenibacillus aurantius]